MRTDVNITVDLDELFDSLRPGEKVQFIKEHLDVLDEDDFEEYGYVPKENT